MGGLEGRATEGRIGLSTAGDDPYSNSVSELAGSRDVKAHLVVVRCLSGSG
jgi:hypothetical protein